MDFKTGIARESLIVGFTAWLWLLPSCCLYSGRTFDDIFVGVIQLSIGGGANLLAFLTLSTATLGILGESLSFALEKFFAGATSEPRRWYSRHVGQLDSDHWHAAQERIWSSPQAHAEFTGDRIRVLVSRALILNSTICLGILTWAAVSRHWMIHFTLFAWIAGIAFLIGVLSWWIATATYAATVRVAGDMQKKALLITRP